MPFREHTLKCDHTQATKALFKLGVWLLEEHEAKNFPRQWGSTFSFELFAKPRCHLVYGLRWQVLQHLRYQAVGRPAGLVPNHLPSCTENPVHCDLYPTPLESYAPIAADPLTSGPFSLHFRCFRFVVVAPLTVGSDLLCPLASILADTSVDSEFRDHWSVGHFPGQDGSACLEFSACPTGDLAQLLFPHRVSALSCLRCHIPDLVLHTEFVLDRGCSVNQPFSQKDQSLIVIIVEVTSWAENRFLKLVFFQLLIQGPSPPTV